MAGLELPGDPPIEVQIGTRMAISAAADGDTRGLQAAIETIGPRYYDGAVVAWTVMVAQSTQEAGLLAGGPGAKLAERMIAAARRGGQQAVLDVYYDDESRSMPVVFEALVTLLRLLGTLDAEATA